MLRKVKHSEWEQSYGSREKEANSKPWRIIDDIMKEV